MSTFEHLPIGGVIEKITADGLLIKGDNGETFAACFHGQVHHHVKREVGVRVAMRYASGRTWGWWVATPDT